MLIGKGSYGLVYGNPRLPFFDETLKDIENKKEVSKVFGNQTEAMKEYNIINKFQNYLNNNDFLKIKQFFILPSQGGNINLNEIISHPEIYSKKFPKYFETYQLSRFVISYPQGDFNLNDCLHRINHLDFFFEYLQKSLNILEGIQLLQNNNLVHFDLKNSNMMLIDDFFKIIDLTNIFHLSESYNNDLPVGNMLYVIWPFTHLYTLFYLNNEKPIIHLNSRIFLNQYTSFKQQNLKNYQFIKECFVDAFDVRISHGFSPEQVDEIKNKFGINLLLQKFFKDPEELNLEEKFKVFKFFENTNLELSFFQEDMMVSATKSLVKKFNEYFSRNSKKDMFFRTDIYSFGVFILMTLNQLLKFINKNKIILIQEKINIIYQLYNFVYLACYQTENCMDINLLVEKYKKILF
jgi:hypothetical protein